jgi:anti-sigma factor RsiW
MTNLSGHLTDAQAQRLLEGLLDPVTDDGVEAHVARCSDCGALVASYAALDAALDALPVPELPADFTASVMERIELAERRAARERLTAFALVASIVTLAVGCLVAAGAGGLGGAVSVAAERLTLARETLRVAAGVLPGLLGALRLQLLLTLVAAALPVLLGLSRLMPATSARTISP